MKQNERKNNIVLLVMITGFGICMALTGYSIFADLNSDHIVIPYGYTGKVTIIYNQEDGETCGNTERHRLFSVPASGMLKTSSEFYDSKAYQFYYRMPDNSLRLLTQQYCVPPGGMGRVPDDTFVVGIMDISKTSIKGIKSVTTSFSVMKNH